MNTSKPPAINSHAGMPRDYELFVIACVILRSLRHLNVDANIVIIASKDIPQPYGDNVKEIVVDNREKNLLLPSTNYMHRI